MANYCRVFIDIKAPLSMQSVGMETLSELHQDMRDEDSDSEVRTWPPGR